MGVFFCERRTETSVDEDVQMSSPHLHYSSRRCSEDSHGISIIFRSNVHVLFLGYCTWYMDLLVQVPPTQPGQCPERRTAGPLNSNPGRWISYDLLNNSVKLKSATLLMNEANEKSAY